LKTGSIQRVTTPNAASQTVTTIGSSSDGKQILSAAFVGGNLYLAEGLGVSVIPNIASCSGSCRATFTQPSVSLPQSLAYDGNGNLYVGSNLVVTRFNFATRTQSNYAMSGISNGTTTFFQFISGLGLDPQGNLYVGDDPSRGTSALQGRLWKVAPAP